jgi:hypothetical protein
MGLLDDLFRPRRRRASHAPATAGESFWINLVKSFGRALGGPFGRALAGPKRRRRSRWQR